MIFPYKTTLIRPTSCLPVVLAILILTGCATVGPDYVPPNKSVSKDWHTQLKGGLATGEMDPQALAAWWTTLNDPELSSLIDRAVLGNLDLKSALARVREARARRGIAKADLFPSLDATGSASWSRINRDKGSSTSDDFYLAGFDAGW